VRWWKILGLAGFAGVAATGVVIARAERQRRAYTPDQVRERLHARLAESPQPTTPGLSPAETRRSIPWLLPKRIGRRLHFPQNGQTGGMIV
jgi:hypothetical protein